MRQPLLIAAIAAGVVALSVFAACGEENDPVEFPAANVGRAVLDYYRAAPGYTGEAAKNLSSVKCDPAGTERGAQAFRCVVGGVEAAEPVRFLARDDGGVLKVGKVDGGGEAPGVPTDAEDAERRLLPSLLVGQLSVGVQGSELSCERTDDAVFECTVMSDNGEPYALVVSFNEDGTLAPGGPIDTDESAEPGGEDNQVSPDAREKARERLAPANECEAAEMYDPSLHEELVAKGSCS